MRIAVIGQAAFGKDVLEALVEKGEDVAAVLCPPDRKDRPFDPIKESAVERDIPVYQYKRMRDEEAIKEFSSLGIHLSVWRYWRIPLMELFNTTRRFCRNTEARAQ